MTKVFFQNEFGAEEAKVAQNAGATLCESWELRNLPIRSIVVTQSTIGWWGVYRRGVMGRICRRQSLQAAVRAAAKAAP